MIKMPWICPACFHGNFDQFRVCINCGVKNPNIDSYKDL